MTTPIILSYGGHTPIIHPSAFIAPGVVIIGNVEIGPESSVWPGCVLRGDLHEIRVGARTNIQDGTVVHVTSGGVGVHIGDGVTIGHMALIHDCTIGDHSFIGMKALVMDRAAVEANAVLGAGSLLPSGKIVPSGQLWVESPAKFKRDLTDSDRSEFTHRAQEYFELSQTYR